MTFQFVLPKAQGLLVSLDVRPQPAQIGGLLRGHPATLIQINRLLGPWVLVPRLIRLRIPEGAHPT